MSFLTRYRSKEVLPVGLASLYTSRTIVLVAMGFLSLFLPIFLLEQYGSLQKVIVFYFITWLAYLLLAAPGAKVTNYIGLKLCLALSLPCLALFYLSLYFFAADLVVWTTMAGLAL